MKLKHYLIAAMLILASCSEREEKLPIDNSIQLSSYSVHFLAGDEYFVEVLSESKELALQEENPKIASAWWTNNRKSIRIKGESIGNTSIIIFDPKQPDTATEIKVISDYFCGDYKEDGSKAIAIVHVKEKDIQENIENKLKTLAEHRTGMTYSFNKNLNTVTINEPGGNKLTGKYDWKINRLKITTNGITYDYSFRHIEKASVELELDLSGVFKQEYPTATIYTVRLLLFLSQHSLKP